MHFVCNSDYAITWGCMDKKDEALPFVNENQDSATLLPASVSQLFVAFNVSYPLRSWSRSADALMRLLPPEFATSSQLRGSSA